MAYREELSWDEVKQKMLAPCRTLIREIAAAKEVSAYMADAQDTLTDLAWGRILFDTGDTRNVTLTIDATAKTIECLPGAGLFEKHKVGRDVQITGFVTAGNNQTTEITSKVSNDKIGISSATGLVNETDTTARAQGNPDSIEQDWIDKLQLATAALDSIDTTLQANIDAIRDFS